ncbi:MAG TPA: S24 family peptidase [Candidatus Saccharimonadales bacterium]|nr:S24 family peptidase [Candidatus Saccharimonadales bacterium]
MDAGEPGITMDSVISSDTSWLDQPAADGVSIHTGFPNAAADKRLRGLDLNQLLIKNPSSTFMFRVRGEEGITQGIFNGDLAIVDRITPPRPQDLVLWHDGAQFNLSRPTRLDDSAVVWGTVTAVIHQYREGREPTNA